MSAAEIEADKEYRAYVVSCAALADGDQPDVESLREILILAGRSTAQFGDDVACCRERLRRRAEHDALDFDGQIGAADEAARQAVAEFEEQKSAFAEASRLFHAARDKMATAHRHRIGLTYRQSAHVSEYTTYMGRTASPDLPFCEPENFRLAPGPVVEQRAPIEDEGLRFWPAGK